MKVQRTHTRTHTHPHTHTNTHTHTHTHTRTHARTHAHTRTHTRTHTHTHTYIHTRARTHAHTHARTPSYIYRLHAASSRAHPHSCICIQGHQYKIYTVQEYDNYTPYSSWRAVSLEVVAHQGIRFALTLRVNRLCKCCWLCSTSEELGFFYFLGLD